MSILPVRRVTLVGPLAAKESALEGLQDLGCLHPESEPAGDAATGADRPQARRALAYLLASPVRRHAARSDEPFDAAAVEREALRVEARTRALDEERRAIRRRLRVLEPWGEHDLDPAWLARGLRLWFYVVPHWQLARLPTDDVAWQVVARDQGHCWVVVLSADEPCHMPCARDHTGSVSLRELRRRLQDIESELDDLLVQRIGLTRWCTALAAELARIEDAAARRDVARGTRDGNGLFVLTGWAPAAAWPALQRLADVHRLVVVADDPAPGEQPPTLLSNAGAAKAGQALLGFFVTPGYRSWDPSAWVLVSFTVFFGMVVGDAGYALLLAAALGAWMLTRRGRAVRRQAPEAHRFALGLVASTALFGVLTGSWFGLAPPPGHLLASAALLSDAGLGGMMALSLAVGVLHLGLASLAAARASRGWRRAGACGWALLLAGAAGLGTARAWPDGAPPWLQDAASVLAVAGGCFALFSALAEEAGWGGRAAALLKAVMRLPGLLGDTLSYLRLFALALAGAAMAAAMNELAAKVVAGVPAFGVLLAGILLLIGHGLNLVLGVAGALVHGLRLNFIEFLNWSGVAEGRPFVAFRRKDHPPWTPLSQRS